MPARSFLGFDDSGRLGFDLGDGNPTYLPPTDATVGEAMRLEAGAGRDPAAVLGGRGIGPAPALDPALAGALPPRRSAMGADALAAGPAASTPDGRKPSLMWDAPADKPNPFMIEVDPAKAPPARPQLPAGPIEIQSGPGDISAAKAAGMSQPQIDRMRSAAYRAEEAAKAAPAATPAGPALSAGTPGAGLVATPTGGGGGGAAAGGGGPGGPTFGPASKEYSSWLKSEIAAEANKRPSGGTLVKGGKVQTNESWQGMVGPNADTMAAMRDNATAAQKEGRLVAASDAELAQKKADLDTQAALAEQKAAETKAEIQQRSTAALGQIGGQMSTLQKKIQGAEIDPTRWFRSKDTADKSLLAISMLLGGVAQVFTKTADKPNPVLQAAYSAMDRDVDAQIKNIDKAKGDLSDLQRIYIQTREQYGDEGIAADVTKIAALQGFKAQLAQETAKAQAVQGVERVNDERALKQAEAAYWSKVGADTPMARAGLEKHLANLAGQTRSYSIRARVAELATERAELEKRADLEAKMNGTLAKQFGFAQDRVVGGSAGADPKKIRGLFKELNDVEGDQRKLTVSEREAQAKGQTATKGLFVDGEFIPASPNAQPDLLKDAQARITYSDSLLGDIAAVRKRMGEAGAYAPGDPQAGIDAGLLAKSLSRAASNEAASESDVALVKGAVTPGPRQAAALERIEKKARSFKVDALKSVGAAKLWPALSRCTTRQRVRPSRSTRRRPGPSSVRGRPPLRPTRTCPWSGKTAACRCSKGPTRGLTSPAPPVSRAGPRAAPRCESSSCKTSSAGSGASWAPPPPASPAAPRSGSPTPP